jgi:CubicO group peptidase (beta-lactamase class C family)
VQDEICAPLGIGSLWLGIPDEVEPRVATIVNMPAPPPNMPIQLPPFLRLAIPGHLATNQETFGRADIRRSCQPGAGGIMNARSLARHYALLAGRGAVGPTRLLSPERVDRMRELYTDEPDAVLGTVYRRGLGYWLGGDLENAAAAAMGANPRALGHPGAGGSIGWADPETGLAVAVVKNRMLGGSATPEKDPVTILGNAVRRALGLDTLGLDT